MKGVALAFGERAGGNSKRAGPSRACCWPASCPRVTGFRLKAVGAWIPCKQTPQQAFTDCPFFLQQVGGAARAHECMWSHGALTTLLHALCALQDERWDKSAVSKNTLVSMLTDCILAGYQSLMLEPCSAPKQAPGAAHQQRARRPSGTGALHDGRYA